MLHILISSTRFDVSAECAWYEGILKSKRVVLMVVFSVKRVLGAHLVQCKRSATILVCGRTRDPYLVILGGHHSCLRVHFDTSSTLGVLHFWIFT